MNDKTEQAYSFDKLLAGSVKVHGHLCAGQVWGVRMSMLGLREIGVNDPIGKDRKNIIVFVEMDRCAADAVQSVTGCSLGRRTLRFLDYGKMAATFMNLKTGKAVRIIAREDSRQKAKDYFPLIENKYAAQLEAYKILTDEELFNLMEVSVDIRPQDMPGRPLRRLPCDVCGEHVQDIARGPTTSRMSWTCSPQTSHGTLRRGLPGMSAGRMSTDTSIRLNRSSSISILYALSGPYPFSITGKCSFAF